MSSFAIAGLTIFILILFLGIFSVVYGLPGTFIILIDVVIYAWVTDFEKIGFKTIVILVLISLFAEAMDFLLGMIGAKKYGASRKGIIASVIGGIAGAILMTPLLLGLGAVIGAFLGGAVGTFLVEYLEDRKLKAAFRMGYGVMLGKIASVFLKGFLAILMSVISLMAIYS